MTSPSPYTDPQGYTWCGTLVSHARHEWADPHLSGVQYTCSGRGSEPIPPRGGFSKPPQPPTGPSGIALGDALSGVLGHIDDQKGRLGRSGHYRGVVPGIECIDVVQHFNFNRGNVIKYVWRAGEKGSEITDLKKARDYLDFEIARMEAADAGEPVT